MRRDDWKRHQGYLAPVRARDEEKLFIEREAQRLLEHLYDPDPELGWRCSARAKARLGGNEPINWGDLNVVEVTGADPFTIHIEEASPDCPLLAKYIVDTFADWGWTVRVRTEW